MTLNKFKHFFLYLGTFPVDLVGWLIVGVAGSLWGVSKPSWEKGVLKAVLKEGTPLTGSGDPKSLFSKWGGLTIGHAILLREGMPDDVMDHELVHVEQNESNGLLGLLLGLSLIAWLPFVAVVLWCLMPSLVYLAGMLTAFLRSEESVYRNNHLEEAAYDKTN